MSQQPQSDFERFGVFTNIGELRSAANPRKTTCAYCFSTKHAPDGLYLCLQCNTAVCKEHMHLHANKYNHTAYCHRKVTIEEPVTVTELTVNPIAEKSTIALHDYGSGKDYDMGHVPENLGQLMVQLDASVDYDVDLDGKGWAFNKKKCTHVKVEPGPASSAAFYVTHAKCASCDINTNLWVCLDCGLVSCGRRQHDGSGGNGHALKHFEETGHPLCVKIGSLSPTSNDVHCYACDDEVEDTLLDQRLAAIGIDINALTASEKTLTEMTIAQNNNLSLTTVLEGGKDLTAAHGPWVHGIHNKGNLCYAASVVQAVLCLPQVRNLLPPPDHFITCPKSPYTCPLCQFARLRAVMETVNLPTYVQPDTQHLLDVVAPRLCRGEERGRQQDALEMAELLFQVMDQQVLGRGGPWHFTLRYRLQCANPACGAVRYREGQQSIDLPLYLPAETKGDNYAPPTVERLLMEKVFGATPIDFKCEACGCPQCMQTTQMESFPEVLVLSAKRFAYNAQYQQIKIHTPLEAPDVLKLGEHAARPKPANELIMSSKPVDPQIVFQLTAMGFEPTLVQKAAQQAGSSLEAAIDLLANPEALAASPEMASGAIEGTDQVVAMGFTEDQAAYAIGKAGSVEMAINWLLEHPDFVVPAASSAADIPVPGPYRYKLAATVTHSGGSINSGHYVSHRRVDGATIQNAEGLPVTGEDECWVVANDAKTAVSPAPPRHLAYLYVYVRC